MLLDLRKRFGTSIRGRLRIAAEGRQRDLLAQPGRNEGVTLMANLMAETVSTHRRWLEYICRRTSLERGIAVIDIITSGENNHQDSFTCLSNASRCFDSIQIRHGNVECRDVQRQV